MPSSRQSHYWQLGISVALGMSGAIGQSGDRALAQSNIVPDSTLGNESSVVVPNFNGLPVEAIGGGAARGQNLFHSFQQFNVSAGRGAYFFSPSANIQNILARVTGNNLSQILGTLGTFGNSSPNLFLINPNGIIFGSNASLDIGGSFVATTANAIRLGNTGLFSASHPRTSNLLSINPSAFFFNAFASQAQIVNRSTATSTVLGASTSGLQVPDGRSLLLVGGDVKLEGGSLFAPGGRVELAGVAGTGTVGFNAFGNELRLGFPTDVARADVSLTNESEVNVRAGGGGSIAINARNLEVLGGSKVRTGIASGLGSADSKAGDIQVNATGTTTVAGDSFISNAVIAGGVGNGGDIDITTGSLFVTDGAYLIASTDGQGNAGSVRIRATDTVSFDRASGGAGSPVGSEAVGNGGDIDITTGSLSVSNGASLYASTAGKGNAGSVRIRATDTVRFDGGDAFSAVEAGAVGDGGDIKISTGSLEVTKGAQLIASTYGQGNAGSVRIRATDTVSFDGTSSDGFRSAAFNNVEAGAVGGGGDIDITTGSLEVINGAQLSASTYGQGNAGSVRIRATDTVSFDRGNAFSKVGEGAVGDGGDIEITTGSLSVTNGSQLIASTYGQGNAGSVKIRATDIVRFNGTNSNGFSSGAFSSVEAGAVGDGGGIEITTNSLLVTNGAQLSASTFGQGKAGSVRIRATDTVSFDGGDAFSAVGTGAVGNGGDIEITTNSLEVTNGSFLFGSTAGQGNAGSVRIRATDKVRFDGVGSNGASSGANSAVGVEGVGNGGDIEITTGSLEVTNGASLVTDTFGHGKAGSVRITATDKVRFDGVASNGASSGAFSMVGSRAVGNGGDIEITTGSLSVSNGAAVSGGTFGQGNSGNVRITANGSLSVTNGALLYTSTAGQGNAGSVRINVDDTVSFDGVGSNGVFSGAYSSVGKGAVGDGGDIEITTNSLSLTNGASLLAATFGKGKAGSLRVKATDTVRFDGGYATSAVGSGAEGNGGDIEITTSSMSVTNGFQVLASTFGQGDAGNIKITATDQVSFNSVGNNGQSSGAFSAVGAGAVGNGGDIKISTGSLEVTNGAVLSAQTDGQGNAGNIKITATDKVRFAGVGNDGRPSGAFSAVGAGGQGNGGRTDITSHSLSLTDAYISSVSLGTGIAGDINLQTRQNLEMNRSQIVATTQSGDGGNIKLGVGNILLMRNGSKISTTAGIADAGGNGGNININADFVAAVSTENSDITANAYNGRGGNINITTSGIYGLKYREHETPLSDITASSQYGINGEFQLDLLTNVDPSRGLTELPTDVVDATRQIDRRCTPAGTAQQGSSFTITGRGGLPPSPNDPLQGEAVVTNWVSLDSDREHNTPPAKTKPSSSAPKQLVEAQGWVINEKGQVVLTASAPKVTPHREWFSPPECNPPQSPKAPQS